VNTLAQLVRSNIRTLKAYSSAREQYMDYELTLLDANENAQGAVGAVTNHDLLNRYPDPYQRDVKSALAALRDHQSDAIVLGNGSDEIIDLLIRIFCEPGSDNIVITAPTYGMYRVSAEINNVDVIEVPLTDRFDLNAAACLQAASNDTKIVFLCSPNNPTGNLLSRAAIEQVLNSFKGVVVIDEAYIDFAETASMSQLCKKYPKLLVMQTFSKSWGLAGIRLGIGYTSPEMVHYFNKVKPPYNINQLTQRQALQALQKASQLKDMVRQTIEQRAWLASQLDAISGVECVFPSQANFLLVRFRDPEGVFQYLIDQDIIVRNRSNVHQCEGCLRISVGTEKENIKLIEALNQYQS